MDMGAWQNMGLHMNISYEKWEMALYRNEMPLWSTAVANFGAFPLFGAVVCAPKVAFVSVWEALIKTIDGLL